MKRKAGGGEEGEGRRGEMPSVRRNPHGYSSQSGVLRGGQASAMNVGNYLSCIARSPSLLGNHRAVLEPRGCRYPGGFGDERMANRSLSNDLA